MREGTMYFNAIHWRSCPMQLSCLHAQASCEHPLSVFEAILKFSRRLSSLGTVFHFLPEHGLAPLRTGRLYYLRLVFPRATEAEILGVQEAIRQWLKDSKHHFAVSFGGISCEDAASAIASLPCPAGEEMCLDFLSPVDMSKVSSEQKRPPNVPSLCSLMLDRVEKIFGPMPEEEKQALLESSHNIKVIPYSWDYKEHRHASRSSGGVQFLNGYQGRLLLKGNLRPLAPLFAIGARIGCGSHVGFGLGAFRLSKADLLRQEWASTEALESSLQFLNSHGYALSKDCIPAFRRTVQEGALLSREALLLAQEAFLRLMYKTVKLAFPCENTSSPCTFPWETLKSGLQGGENGLESLAALLSAEDQTAMPVIREVWQQRGVPQIIDLRTRVQAGDAVREARSLGIEASLGQQGICLASVTDTEAMLDLLARSGIVPVEGWRESLPDDEGELITPWKRHLHILHPHAAIGLDADAVIARFDGEVLSRTPLGQVSALILHGAGSVSAPLMRHCMQEDIPIMLFDGGRLTAAIAPQSPAWRKRGRDHARSWERLGTDGRFAMAKELISAKVENFLCKTPRSMKDASSFLAAGQKAMESIQAATSPQELLGAEGAFAHVAFRSYNDCLIAGEFHSLGRHPRTRQDIWNTALDMVSSLTFQNISMALAAEGLDPYLGLFHCQNLRYMTLAADIQELFRADMERWLIRTVNQNMLRQEHFAPKEEKFGLTREGRHLFLLEWEKAMQTRYSWQPASLRQSLERQVRSLRLWLCSGIAPELYTGTGWRSLPHLAFAAT